MKRLVHVLTVAESLRFLRGQPSFMASRGYETHVVCAPGALLDRFAEEEGATPHGMPMERAITPRSDLRTTAALARLLHQLSADVVHAQTPKGGLLGVLSGRAARVPRVLYHMRGLPFRGARGARRRLLRTTERVACGLAHDVVCQSPSLRRVAESEGILRPGRALVLGRGGNGVDAHELFDPQRARPSSELLRAELRLEGALTIGFVGRLVRDKGLVELTEAWRALRDEMPELRLLVVGPFERGDPVPASTRRALEQDSRVILVGETQDVAPLYGLMDVLALPSYREGFPNVPLEAAAMGVPVVATRVEGCVDAVLEGVTGALVPPRDASALADALRGYLRSRERRRDHGSAARAHVIAHHAPEQIWEALYSVYEGQRDLRPTAVQ